MPLIGKAGRVHNSMLRVAGIERNTYAHTNVFDEELPGNKVGAWCASAEERRSWSPSYNLGSIGKEGFLRPDHVWHLDRLRDEILRWKPNVIVPLGGTATWALTGVAGIGSCRGAVAEAKLLVPGMKILPTFHPAFVARQWKFFHVVVGDYIKATCEAAYPEIRLPVRRLLLEPTIEEVEAYADKLMQGNLVSADIETGWHQITCFGMGPDKTEGMCIPFVDLRKTNRSYWSTAELEARAWTAIKQVMECPVPKLGQNFTYDAYWTLGKMGIRVINYCRDTRLLHHALYPELPKDLGFLGASYTDMGPWKLLNARHREKRDD